MSYDRSLAVDISQGGFLPFHRVMMYAHEQALRTECNYSGYQP
jgi:hypothetical protein